MSKYLIAIILFISYTSYVQSDNVQIPKGKFVVIGNAKSDLFYFKKNKLIVKTFPYHNYGSQLTTIYKIIKFGDTSFSLKRLRRYTKYENNNANTKPITAPIKHISMPSIKNIFTHFCFFEKKIISSLK